MESKVSNITKDNAIEFLTRHNFSREYIRTYLSFVKQEIDERFMLSVKHAIENKLKINLGEIL